MKIPLADRLRPKSIDDVVGQHHLFDVDKPLRKMIESSNVTNLIFYGPPGVGKTTVAKIIAEKTNLSLRKLNGINANTSDIKGIISEIGTFSAQNGVLLFLDEIQYFSKKQQQTLLEVIENGNVTLIASTTENPYFYIYNAILSRSTVFEFKLVEVKDIKIAVQRGITKLQKELNCVINISDDDISKIASMSSGDVRKSLNTLEFCLISSESSQKDTIKILSETVENMTGKCNFRYDRNSDEHYDTISAFQKSMRGSDPDASIYYLSRLILAGDLISICRRLLICACEDVGLAYPQIIPIVKACTDIAMQVGLPEARIPLSEAVLLVCNSPKSNSAYQAVNNAIDDLNKGCNHQIPRHLQNNHYDGDDVKNKGQIYKYPHQYKSGWVDQTYLPEQLLGKTYYEFGDNKVEQSFKNYWQKIKKDKNTN